MKNNFTCTGKNIFYTFLIVIFLFPFTEISAQTQDTSLLYGMTKTGKLFLINTTNADCGTAINPAYAGTDTALEANALGYDSVNKSFYYIKRNFIDSPMEFVSFNTSTNQYTTLSTPPITGTVLRGCVNSDGSGYYCFDLHSNLFYYDIASDQWTLITSYFVDEKDNNVSNVLDAYPSGDIAFDGAGNMWVLCSTAFQYGLYKIPAPISKTAVDSITAELYVEDTAFLPHLGYPFGGIAFNSTGQIFLSSASTENQLYLLQDNLKLIDIGTLSVDGAGADLASNNYPVTHLPVTYLSFNGILQNDIAVLNWSTASEINNKGFEVQKSTDGQTFTGIGFVAGNGNSTNINDYTFSDPKLVSGNNYYRLKQIDLDGKFNYSGIINLSFSKFDWAILGNPSNNMWVQLQLDKQHDITLRVVSISGTVTETITKGSIERGTYSIPLNLKNAAPGMYVVTLLVDGQSFSKNIVKPE